MLFSSYGFILLFLPATLPLFHLAGRRWPVRAALSALVLASSVFSRFGETPAAALAAIAR